MNKTAIKNYAVWARSELIERVSQKAFQYGISETTLPELNTESINGNLLSKEEKNQLNECITVISKQKKTILEGQKKKNEQEALSQAFYHIMEEVAYTWFNRFIALRFMEVNNYLPQKVKVFTNGYNEFKPEILKEAIYLDIENLDKEKVSTLMDENKEEELYKYLLLTLCNDMNQYLPEMFTSIKDYKTLLFPDNLLREDSILDKLVKDIPEEDWTEQVQIIGWLYQYYNSELKDLVMKKKNYTKDDIPAATQLFTPDWIVRYMTENSLGRLWIDGHPDFNHDEWKYYLEEAQQEPNVIEQLNKIKEEHAKLNPEDIKVIDPCMGSGHILVYAFEVLMDIYRDCGYTDRDAAQSILENNLYGLEIDERAYHLAYFSLMMKARSYNRRILSKRIELNLVEIKESEEINLDSLEEHKELAQHLIETFKEAKEYGSILILDCKEQELRELQEYLNNIDLEDYTDLIGQDEKKKLVENLKPLVKQALLLTQKYDVVITNPPYMAPSPKQKPYVLKHYKNYKTDLFAIFQKKCKELTIKNGYQAMIVLPSFLFLSSFENARKELLNNQTICSLLHMGRGIFGIDFGSTSFVLINASIKNYNGKY